MCCMALFVWVDDVKLGDAHGGHNVQKRVHTDKRQEVVCVVTKLVNEQACYAADDDDDDRVDLE